MAKKGNRSGRSKQSKKKPNRIVYALVGVGVLVGLGALFAFLPGGRLSASLAFPDIHGMSFSADGDQLIVATHTGLNVYENDQWTFPDYPKNDYMGYTGYEEGFYASGHPGEGSPLPNPIGLVISEDYGQSIEALNFVGEIDFHTTAASYRTGAIYVVNPQPTRSMQQPGLHYSTNAGASWEQSAGNGLTRGIIQIAAHPDDPNQIAAATQSGLYISNNYGNTFEQVVDGLVTSVAFDLTNPDVLLYGFTRLFSYNTQTAELIDLFTPELSSNDDALMYITVDPDSSAIAIATFSRQIDLSNGSRDAWTRIVRDGMSAR
jgi:hypothetical protein